MDGWYFLEARNGSGVLPQHVSDSADVSIAVTGGELSMWSNWYSYVFAFRRSIGDSVVWVGEGATISGPYKRIGDSLAFTTGSGAQFSGRLVDGRIEFADSNGVQLAWGKVMLK